MMQLAGRFVCICLMQKQTLQKSAGFYLFFNFVVLFVMVDALLIFVQHPCVCLVNCVSTPFHYFISSYCLVAEHILF